MATIPEFLKDYNCSYNDMEYWRITTTNARRYASASSIFPHAPLAYIEPSSLSSQFEIENQTLAQRKAPKGEIQVLMEWEPHFSSTPLDSLKSAALRDMHLWRYHKGQYLLCRTVYVINLDETGFIASLAVEDTEGWAQRITLYNYPCIQNTKQRELDTMVPLGSVLVIREPYFKIEFCTDRSYIEISSPSDIVYLEPTHSILNNVEWKTGSKQHPLLANSAAQWKKIADRHLMSKEYFAAAVAYSNALQLEPSLTSARISRALAYINLGAFTTGLHDSKVALQDEKISQAEKLKATQYSARAEYLNGDYEASMRSFLDCCTLDPTDKNAKPGVQRCVRRLKEKKKGDYDWTDHFLQGRAGVASLDIAEYTGPLEVVTMANRGGGRGVSDSGHRCWRTIAKPLASAEKEQPDKRVFRVFQSLSGLTNLDVDFQVYQKSVLKIALDPASFSIFDLYDGRNEPPTSATKVPSLSDHPLRPVADIDIPRIRTIGMTNQFAFHYTVDHEAQDPRKASKPPHYRLSGLYMLPSYFNHECAPNCDRTNFGDALILRATRKVKKGEELTVTYTGWNVNYEKRTFTLSYYRITCDCDMCVQDRMIDSKIRQKRIKALEQMKYPGTSLSDKHRLVKEVEESYPQSYSFHKCELYEANDILFRHYRIKEPQLILHQERIKPVITVAMNALEALRIRVIDRGIDKMTPKGLPISTENIPYDAMDCVRYCIELSIMMLIRQSQPRSKSWLHAAAWVENAKYGGGITMFKAKYADSLGQLGPLATQFLADAK